MLGSSAQLSINDFISELSHKNAKAQLEYLQTVDRKWLKYNFNNYYIMFISVLKPENRFKYLEFIGCDEIFKSDIIKNIPNFMMVLKTVPEGDRLSFYLLIGWDWVNSSIRKFDDIFNILLSLPKDDRVSFLLNINHECLINYLSSVQNLIKIFHNLEVKEQLLLVHRLEATNFGIDSFMGSECFPDLIASIYSISGRSYLFKKTRILPEFFKVDTKELILADNIAALRYFLSIHELPNETIFSQLNTIIFNTNLRASETYTQFKNWVDDNFKTGIDKNSDYHDIKVKALHNIISKLLLNVEQHILASESHETTLLLNHTMVYDPMKKERTTVLYDSRWRPIDLCSQCSYEYSPESTAHKKI